MQLDELRSLLLSERETGRLVQIPKDLYSGTGKDLSDLLTKLYAIEDPFSDEARLMIERVNAIRETLADLFRTRSEKILSFAKTQEGGSHLDREEIKKMLPEEKEMFDQLVLALEQARCRLVEGKFPRPPGHAQDEEEPCATLLAEAVSLPKAVLSRVLQDMEPFMGVDGRIYQLMREDLVTLPERNAEVLCERNIVLNINPGK
jgi:DNA replication factor GINS